MTLAFVLLALIALAAVLAAAASGANSYEVAPLSKYFTGTARAGATVNSTSNSTKRHIRGARKITFHWSTVNDAGNTPTLDAKLQHSMDGVNFIDTGLSMTQVTTGSANQSKVLDKDIMPWVRLAYTIGGTASPSYTVRAWITYDEDRTSMPSSPLASE